MSARSSLTENVSALNDTTLKYHMEASSSYIKYATNFINKIRQLPQVSEDSFLAAIDVNSLYSNIMHKGGIEACS